MALDTILKAIPIVGSVVSAVQGNQNRQRAKGEITKAYTLGRQRLDLRQGDIRRTQAERLASRGLAQGGIRLRTAPIAPAMVDGTKVDRATQDMNVAIRETREAGRRRGANGQNPAADAARIQDAIAARDTAVETLNTTANAGRINLGGARTLGEQQQLDLAREQQIEQDGMLQARNNALAGVDAGYTQALVNGGANAIAGTLSAMQTPAGAFGIDPRDPLKTADWGKGVSGVEYGSTYGPPTGTTVDKFNTFDRKG